MKKFSIAAVIVMVASFAQLCNNPVYATKTLTMTDNPNDKQWQKVDSLKDSGQPKAAMDLVESIYQRAAKEKDSPEYTKALLYKIRLSSEFEENHLEKSISMLNQSIARADMPAFSVLHSIQAELYFRYFTANRHLILDRTMLVHEPGNDIKTWDATAIISKAAYHYLQSVKDTDELKKTPAHYFSSILDEKKDSKIYRPTLFDLLGHRALDFFMSPQASLIQPDDPQNLNDESFFADAGVFANDVLPKPESLSFNYHALELFRQLIGFHLSDQAPLALIDVDLKRYKWVRDNSTLGTSDQLYINALEQLEKQYDNTDAFPEIIYAIAIELQRIGNTYHPFENQEPRLKLKEAVNKLELAVEHFPNLPSTKNCENLLKQLKQPFLQLQCSNVNLPDKPFKTLISHKNVKEIHLRIISLDPETDYELRNKHRRTEELLSAYLKIEPFTSWRQDLPDDGDLQTHHTEIPFPELPTGYYIVIAGFDINFSVKEKTLPFTSFWMSGISYVSRRSADGSMHFLVLNRENGRPLKGVRAIAYTRQYNQRLREYELNEWTTYRTSRDGTFTIPAPGRGEPSATFMLDFSQRNDRLLSDNFFSQQRYERDKRIRTNTHFFTDRSLYRPGQTVYFKGIILDTDGESNELRTDHPTNVILLDANRQKIAEIALKTNAYGSFSGSFTLPVDLLTGNFQLSNEHGSAFIAVEEYKLPQFEVSFDTISDSYKLGETLTVHGHARAYAGNPVPGAEVKFRVTRQTRFPYFGFRSRSFIPSSPETEIINGTLQTDAEGKFSISFEAIPDLTIASESNPVFIFNIMAGVTDIQGETQHGETSISVGYIALLLGVDLSDNVNRSNFDAFTINAANLNGQPQDVTGRLVISKLREPERVMRERNHTRPDRFVMDKATHDKLFPFDEYDNELDPHTWGHEKQVFVQDFNTAISDKVSLSDPGSWEPGKYLIEMKSEDAFGEPVEFRKHFTLFAPADDRLPENKIWWSEVLTPTVEPGGNAKILIGSAVKLSVLFQVEVKGEIISDQRLILNRSTRVLEIPVTPIHLGGFRILLTAVAYNRSFADAITIEVPDKQKELNIELETRRNGLDPGGSEEWTVMIRDHKGNPVKAEMLAGMYDASLDAIKGHNWFFNLYQSHQRRFNWETTHSFSTSSGTASIRLPHMETFFREYDRLNWFGFEMHGPPFMDFRSGGIQYTSHMMKEEGALEAKAAPESDAAAKKEIIADDESGLTETAMPSVMVRRDFRETAFFNPQLLSNEAGEVKLNFTVPESLTRWRLMGLAHTTDLKTGTFEDFFTSSREVMVVANAPRFFRRGDNTDFQVKVVNTTDKELSANVKLELFDALTMEAANETYGLHAVQKTILIPSNGAKDIEWEIQVPVDGPYAVIYRVTAIAGSHSDGEENMIPVLTNSKLLTESMPMFAGAGETRSFELDKLLKSGDPGSTAQHHTLTLEFTSNPVWYAIQALPYLTEAGYRSADALFSRYYANQLASHIIQNNPEIERVFEIWRKTDRDALLSNLEKNQDLKSVVIEETPWLRDALGESERKRQIAVFFDRNQITSELEKSLKDLIEMQLTNGGWPWFPGMRDNRFITQQIVAGFGKLHKIDALNFAENREYMRRIHHAVQYLDDRMAESYKEIKDKEKTDLNALDAGVVSYLYARSFWMHEFALIPDYQEMLDFWKSQAIQHWTGQNIYLQGMIALALHRMDHPEVSMQIMRSLDDRSLMNEEMGMYWRDLRQGYFWYQAPVETQALLIEAYATISNDMVSVEKMQQWLIKQKQTQAWKSNRATSEAIYAILMQGKQTLAPNRDLKVQIGDLTLHPATDPAIREEAGTGYFRMSWHRSEISSEMAKITVNNAGNTIAWGGLYWQYFEQLDRITPHASPMELSRSIMREVLTPSGVVLEPVTPDKPLKIGDKMIMRIELRVDRDLEYVHMKDLRAPAFEPINQLSGYKYQGGLGYYESPRDVGTHFFFQYLPKGTWVFEYPVMVSQTGDFSTGITTIQSLYAPEFTAHSEGFRVRIE